MTLAEAMIQRHSVRKYQDRPISNIARFLLEECISKCNAESGLHIQLVTGEPKAFGRMFSGVSNYIVMAGKKSSNLDELCGYYGEKIVLFAQQLGLNTCWAGLSSANKVGAFSLKEGEAYCISIAVGYGETQGSERSTKVFDDVVKVRGAVPQWFRSGVEAALLAPTALNQQEFRFELLEDGKVKATVRRGILSKVDLGIAKYHFEAGSGKDSSVWA
ncbi:MAG: nitroreductase [Oscillospiraceae bacterium]|nr:nitroreductase [Oscillospiraceae bacterium]